MTGTGAVGRWRVICGGVVCQGWSSQPGGGSGGSESDGPREGLAAGEAGGTGDTDAPGDAGGGAGDDAGGRGDDGAGPAAVLPAPQDAVASTTARTAVVN